MQLAVLLLKAGVFHLELGVDIHKLGVGLEAPLQASLSLCKLLLCRIYCCFLLVPGKAVTAGICITKAMNRPLAALLIYQICPSCHTI